MKIKAMTRLAAVACAMGIAGAVFGSAGAATAATPANPEQQIAVPQDGSCSSGYTQGIASVDLVITNNTSFPMTFDPDLSGPNAGHWNKRPAATLDAGQCEVVNAYTDDGLHVFNLNVVYTTPWGDYMPFEGTANSTSLSFNPNVFENVPVYHENNYYWSGAIDSRYSITSSGESGELHTHFTLTLS